ncbi:MAG: hypothetical protein ACRD12_06340 [Acidimicrobiales bacterium]
MGTDELSPGALLCVFGDRAVQDDREANGRFIPPTSRGKAGMLEGLMQVARGQAKSPGDVQKLDAGFENVMARGDTGEWQLPTLLMSVTAWSLREQGLAELARMASTVPDPVSSAFPTKLFGEPPPTTETCRMTLTRWAPRPSVEGLLLDTLNAGKPTGLTATWKAFGNQLGTEGSLRWAIAITEFGRPDNPWKGLRSLWEREAGAAGQMRMKGMPGFRRAQATADAMTHLAGRYSETMARWRRFNEEERELAQVIRSDAFVGINAHWPTRTTSSYE